MGRTHPSWEAGFVVLRLAKDAEDPLRSVGWSAVESKGCFLFALNSLLVEFLGMDLQAFKLTQIFRVPVTCSVRSLRHS